MRFFHNLKKRFQRVQPKPEVYVNPLFEQLLATRSPHENPPVSVAGERSRAFRGIVYNPDDDLIRPLDEDKDE